MSRKGSFEALKERAESWFDKANEEGATVATETRPPDRIVMLPPADIATDPDQPRKHFDEAKIAELAQTIREKGIVQPLIVTALDDGTIRLVAGERRLRAARLLGLDTVPARMCSMVDAPEIALIENLQREDLNPIEEAEGLLRLKQLRGLTDEQLAERLGKPRTVVTDTIALTRLPDHIREECRLTGAYSKTLLLNILRAPDIETQDRVFEAVKAGKITTVAEAKKYLTPPKPKNGRPPNYRFEKTGEGFKVTVAFSKRSASVDEVRDALQQAIDSLQ